MKTFKEIKISTVYDAFKNNDLFPEEFTNWLFENTMKFNKNTNVTFPCDLYLLCPTMTLMTAQGFIPEIGKPRENKVTSIIKKVAFKNDKGTWDVYSRVMFEIYNRKTTINDKSDVDALGYRSSSKVEDVWFITVKTDVEPVSKNLDLLELVENPFFTE